MSKEWIILGVLAVNTLIALACPVWFWKREAEWKKGVLYGIFILFCPVGGPLYLLCSWLMQRIFQSLEVDREELSFRTDRIRVVLPANEEEEMNVASMQETLLVSDVGQQRRAVLNVLKNDLENSLSAVTVALESADTEISHYAAAAISDQVARFKVTVQQLTVEMERDPENVDVYKAAADVISQFLGKNVLSEIEEKTYVYRYENIVEWLYGKNVEEVTGEMYRQAVEWMLWANDHDKAVLWMNRAVENRPLELPTFRLRLELYHTTGEKGLFFQTLEELKKSGIPLDQETLELIRFFQ